MANCSKCGKPVGCGCSLKNGLCATCVAKPQAENTPKTNSVPSITDLLYVANNVPKE